MSDPRLYLIAYDISSRKRWRRAYKLLTRVGAWAQFSAFFCRITQERQEVLERSLRRLLVEGEDRLMMVDLGPADRAAARISALGEVSLPARPETIIL